MKFCTSIQLEVRYGLIKSWIIERVKLRQVGVICKIRMSKKFSDPACFLCSCKYLLHIFIKFSIICQVGNHPSTVNYCRTCHSVNLQYNLYRIRGKNIYLGLRENVVKRYEKGLGYKKVAKKLMIHKGIVECIIKKFKKFSTVASLPKLGRS